MLDIEGIEIDENGKITRTSYNPDSKAYEEEEIDGELQYYLSDPLFFKGSVSLETFILSISREHLFPFLSDIPDNFRGHMEELELEPTEKENEIQYLEIGREVNLWDTKEVEVNTFFHGVGFQNKHNLPEVPTGFRERYALEYAPLNNLKYLPLSICRNTAIYTLSESTSSSYVSEVPDFFPTVFEVVSSVIKELTICGSVESRKEVFSELMDKVKELTDKDSNTSNN